MPAIDEFNPDTGRVDVGDPRPFRDTGMPGAMVFANKFKDLPVLLDHVMRADFGRRVRHSIERRLSAFHAGIVQHKQADRQGPFVIIRTRPANHSG